jgi:outer membrane receptor protein involved in Fe transport
MTRPRNNTRWTVWTVALPPIALVLASATPASGAPGFESDITRQALPSQVAAAPARLSGLVLDAQAGGPLAGARVEVVAAPGVRPATAGDDGRFDIASLPPGRHTVRVTAAGFRAIVEAVNLAPNQTTTLEFRLWPAVLRYEEQVVVMPSRQQRPAADLPQAISVIDRSGIEQQMPRSTPEALANVPGVLLQKTNHGSGSPYLRGLVGNQVLVLVDGVRLNNSTFRYGPNQYLATIDPASVERIEVQRGSGSVLYGSDAIGGVINIVTRRPRLSDGATRVSGSVAAKVTTAGMEQGGRVEAEVASSRAALRAGFSLRRFGDLVAGGSLGTEAPSGYRENAADASALFGLGRSSLLSISYQHLRQDDVPRFDQVAQRGYERYSFDPQVRDLAAAEWRLFPTAGPVARVSSAVSWQRTRERRERRLVGSTLLIAEQDMVRTRGVTVDVEMRKVAGWTFQVGVDSYADAIGSWRRDEEQATGMITPRRGLYPDGARSSSLAVFVAGSTRRGPLHLDLGTRYSRFTVSATDALFGRLDLRPAAGVGSAAARVVIAPGLELVGSVAQSFRAPNVDDVSTLGAFDYGVEVPSPDLRPERGIGVDVGVRVRGAWAAASIMAYRVSLADLIDRIASSFGGSTLLEGQRVYRKANVARAYVEGLEIESEWRVSPSVTAGGHASYTYGEQPSTGQPMRRIPPLNGLASLRWTSRSASWVEASLRFAGAQRRLAPGDVADHRIAPGGTPGWAVVNVHAGRAFGARFRLTAAAVNLFDKAYRIHGSGIDEYGRSAWVGTQVSF